jgi:hypothetical protein
VEFSLSQSVLEYLRDGKASGWQALPSCRAVHGGAVAHVPLQMYTGHAGPALPAGDMKGWILGSSLCTAKGHTFASSLERGPGAAEYDFANGAALEAQPCRVTLAFGRVDKPLPRLRNAADASVVAKLGPPCWQASSDWLAHVLCGGVEEAEPKLCMNDEKRLATRCCFGCDWSLQLCKVAAGAEPGLHGAMQSGPAAVQRGLRAPLYLCTECDEILHKSARFHHHTRVVISGKPNLSVGEERSSVDVRGKMTLTVAHAAGNSVSQTTVMVDMMS